MKDYNLYPEELKSRRWGSNNSVFAEVGKTDYSALVDSIALNGEPGIVWLENMQKYSRTADPIDWKDYDAKGTNACGEITLQSKEFCNLVETFPSRHETLEEYKSTLKMAYLYGKTVTLIPTHLADWNAVMLKNRRIGVSQSGIIDAFGKHGRREMLRWCDEGYKYIQQLDKIYSDWLCIPRSRKMTTVKPSGSVSLLPGVSAGIHYPHAEYYIRRVRVSKNHPIVLIMKVAGYEIEEDVHESQTVIVSFPVHEKFFVKRKEDVTIWEQCKNVVDLQRFWADNNVSVTVTFKKEERQDIVRVLEAYEDSLKTISFLPLSDHGYEQAPYEQISKERYEHMVAAITVPDFSLITTTPEGSKFCDGESCEIR
jgi:adenosylcobalamin-dependent ribonucleoside-triphosphate reductase